MALALARFIAMATGVAACAILAMPALGVPLMSTERANPTATLLLDGRVLVAGGRGAGGAVASCEIYDPIVDNWIPAAAMNVARNTHAAVMLRDGRVLVVGGLNSVDINSPEIYDPQLDSWGPAAAMSSGRRAPTLTLLPDGRVLAVAGALTGGATLNTAQRYDPVLNAWSPAGTLAVARFDHTATLVNGKVYVIAGDNNPATTSSVEVYDPALNAWSSLSAITGARQAHSATLVSGQIVAAGGAPAFASRRYDPGSDQWTAAGTIAARAGHTATLLPSGKLLVVGGIIGGSMTTTTELYDPFANSWAPGNALVTARQDHVAVMLPDGRILLVGGGDNGSVQLQSAEIYDPGTADAPVWTPVIDSIAEPPGETVTLTGQRFSGVAEGSSGSYLSAPSNYPLVELQRKDNATTFLAEVQSWTDSSATVRIPASLDRGLLRAAVIVAGNRSAARAFALGSPIGIACGAAAECASGHCADGFCCDAACDGPCEVCAVARGSASDGTCGPRQVGALCRPSAGTCDVVELCDGRSRTCPEDRFLASGASSTPSCPPPLLCRGYSADCGCGADWQCEAGMLCAQGRCVASAASGTASHWLKLGCQTGADAGAGALLLLALTGIRVRRSLET